MTYDEHDLIISVTKIIPPLSDGAGYAAKVLHLYVTDTSGRHRLDESFPETWGKTDSEARQNMQLDVDKWIASHNSHIGQPATALPRQ